MKFSPQAAKVYTLLKSGKWVSLVDILKLRIASHTARISDLRNAGYHVECRRQTVKKGKEYQVQVAYRIS